jgi:hypothetical protein
MRRTIELLFILLILSSIVWAIDPEGATVTFVTNSTKVVAAAQARNDSKGAIHTVRLNAENQNSKWKAYIGNVSSTFVLDDAAGYSIYQWNLASSYQYAGQVYVTRDSSATWSGIACASAGNKATEDTRLGHNSGQTDSVNKTFSSTIHKTFSVAGQSISNGTCYSTFTWINNSAQTASQNAAFQEVALWEGSEVVYTTFVENDKSGYRNQSGVNDRVDFQLILPDNATMGSRPARYYFYLELS